MTRKLISKGELLIIAVVLIMAVAAYFILTGSPDDASHARISVQNYPDIYLSLSENTEFILPQNQNVRLKVENHAIAFIASDCPDQVCVHMGFLRRPGQSAACLPNWISLVIISTTGEVDIDIILS